jgi:ribulose-phosphate 3-epimerase
MREDLRNWDFYMVIPAILAKSQKEFKEKIDLVLPYADFIQIDVMDGVFVPNTTWADAKEIKKMCLPMRFEAHLMVKNPEAGSPRFGKAGAIAKWAKAGAFRIIFHIEATKNPDECIRQIKKFKKETGIAINPKTPLAKIKKFLPPRRHPARTPHLMRGKMRDLYVDYVLVMGVDPGFSGQKFQTAALQKIKQIKKIFPRVVIGVDGGVNKTNAKKLYAAGADALCAASSIFKAKNIRKAIEELG